MGSGTPTGRCPGQAGPPGPHGGGGQGWWLGVGRRGRSLEVGRVVLECGAALCDRSGLIGELLDFKWMKEEPPCEAVFPILKIFHEITKSMDGLNRPRRGNCLTRSSWTPILVLFSDPNLSVFFLLRSSHYS